MPKEANDPDDRTYESIERMPDVSGIEIEQDLAWEQKEWRAERVGWILLVLLLLAVALGAFGDGPLSRTVIRRGELSVTIERVARRSAPTAARIDIRGDAEGPQRITMRWSPTTAAVKIRSILPEPASSSSLPDGLELEFHPSAAQGTLNVAIEYSIESAGLVRTRIEGAGENVALAQFVYP